MEPIDFQESNMTLTAPGAMPDCGDLPVYTDGRQCVSCWKMSFKERIKILFTGRVWLGVMGGRTQPPVWVDANKPFYQRTIFDAIRLFSFNVAKFCRDLVQSIIATIKAAKNEPDKRKHFNAGTIIAFIIAMITGIVFGIRVGHHGIVAGSLAGFAAGSLAGIIKEVYDKHSKKGTPERMDLRATILGSFVGSSIAAILLYIALKMI